MKHLFIGGPADGQCHDVDEDVTYFEVTTTGPAPDYSAPVTAPVVAPASARHMYIRHTISTYESYIDVFTYGRKSATQVLNALIAGYVANV